MPAATLHIELPAVIAAFQNGAVEVSERQGHAAVRADIAQSGKPSLRIAADQQRQAQEHLGSHLSRPNCGCQGRGVPKAQERGARSRPCAALWRCRHASMGFLVKHVEDTGITSEGQGASWFLRWCVGGFSHREIRSLRASGGGSEGLWST